MIAALVRKELLILSRDLHAVGSLFLLPVLFIVVMSLALQNVYNPPLRNLPYALDIRDKGELAQDFATRWQALRGAPQTLPAAPEEALRRGTLRYLVRIEPAFSATLSSPLTPKGVQLRLIGDPTLDYNLFRATEAELSALVGELRAEALQDRFTGFSRQGSQSIRLLVSAQLLTLGARPTAVQHSVPAWLIFGMFFIVSSIASLLVQEHDNGTLARLRALGVTPLQLLLAKGLPYLLINTVQVLLMLAVGVWLMPWLGGEGLSLTGANWPALLLMFAAISLAAIGLSLAIASLVRTHAQAASVGPIITVMMAAIGGVMVPRFVMPPVMQQLAACSPMNWGLEGLLAVLLRHASIAEVLAPLMELSIFGAAMLLLAVFLFQRRIQS